MKQNLRPRKKNQLGRWTISPPVKISTAQHSQLLIKGKEKERAFGQWSLWGREKHIFTFLPTHATTQHSLSLPRSSRIIDFLWHKLFIGFSDRSWLSLTTPWKILVCVSENSSDNTTLSAKMTFSFSVLLSLCFSTEFHHPLRGASENVTSLLVLLGLL